ncbi:putative metal-dependent hydrolase, partial [Sphingobacteriales bacterium CHB3]|nr:putative metal-dependent hydrolase [Sphingobacteriales bacterium CHB3]
HHVPDSHLQAYGRFKLALTEERPTIKPYMEDRWAMLPDSELTPVEVSLAMLDALHKRWVVLLKSMTRNDFKRTLFHPEHQKEFSLDGILGMYAWHGKHHLAHILNLKKRMNW